MLARPARGPALPGSAAVEGSSPRRACPDPAWATHAQTGHRNEGASLGQKAELSRNHCPKADDQTPAAPTVPQKGLENSLPAAHVGTESLCARGSGQQGPESPAWPSSSAAIGCVPEGGPRLPGPAWVRKLDS